MDGVYRSSSPSFLHHDDSAALASVGGLAATARSHELVNCSAQCFFAAARQQVEPADVNCGTCGGGGHFQYSAELGPHFGPLWTDGISDGVAALSMGSVGERPGETTANLWIGGRGVLNAAHYDSFHNMFVQLHGQKRFLLMPPGAAINLYTYPRLHPSYRQVQPDLTMRPDDPQLQGQFPRLGKMVGSAEKSGSKSLDVMQVVLNAGEVLYIPPYWFHMATVPKEASGPAVGVNVWCSLRPHTTPLHHDEAQCMASVVQLTPSSAAGATPRSWPWSASRS